MAVTVHSDSFQERRKPACFEGMVGGELLIPLDFDQFSAELDLANWS